jgi:hypothetical protein
MVDWVHGAWRGGSPRKGSAVVFPCDFGEAGGSPTLGMDRMQRGRMEGVMHLFGGGERREGRKSWARWWLTLFKGGTGMEQGGSGMRTHHVAAGGLGVYGPDRRAAPRLAAAQGRRARASGAPHGRRGRLNRGGQGLIGGPSLQSRAARSTSIQTGLNLFKCFHNLQNLSNFNQL